MKIVVCADNHGSRKAIETILNRHQDADYYFHLGDSELYQDELKPFVSVKGNNDFDFNLPTDRIIDTKHHSFYLTHSHFFSSNMDLLINAAKLNDCDVVLFGHTHEYYEQTIKGVKLINPGSCRNNRGGYKPSYVILNIDDNNGKIETVIEYLDFKDIY